MTSPDLDSLPRPALVAALLTVNPTGLGGVWVRARHGPAGETLAAALTGLPGPVARVSSSVHDTALFGGVDLTESLMAGRVVARSGRLSEAALVWITRAETMDPARLLRVVDHCSGRVPLVLWDEGQTDDPLPPDGVLDRLAFYLDETDAAAPGAGSLDPALIARARKRLGRTTASEAEMTDLAHAGSRLGVAGLRSVLFAAETLRTLHALSTGAETGDRLAALAAALVFGHRQSPRAEDDPAPPAPDQSDGDRDDDSARDSATSDLPLDLVVDAVRIALPPDVLDALATRRARADGRGAGAVRRSALRGRPLPSRPGRLDGRNRIDLLGTLTAAAPWQGLRNGQPGAVQVRPDDIRVRRYDEPSQRLILFVVDASGSAAFARLAEGKGAVETLLARAYASRDEVAMIAFRDQGADLVLPPTRALARAKRSLQGLAAGGSTPLATALAKAIDMTTRARAAGQTPHVVLISDGRGNRALDGAPDRARAADEAILLARQFAASAVPVTLLDTGMRPSRALNDLSEALGTKAVVLTRSPRASLADQLVSELTT